MMTKKGIRCAAAVVVVVLVLLERRLYTPLLSIQRVQSDFTRIHSSTLSPRI